MASLTIRLIVDPANGKKNVVISYETESDALPLEHEEEHKRLVDQLIEGGALKAADLGKIIIEREEKKHPGHELPQSTPEAQREAAKQK
jgi:hypothetical protein